MLKGSEYENIKFFGCVIVHLLEERKYVEYRVEKDFIDIVMTMNPIERMKEVKAYKERQADREIMRKNLLTGAFCTVAIARYMALERVLLS